MHNYKEYGYQNDKHMWSHNYLFEHILNLLDRKKNKTILDVGCGNCSLAIELIKLGFNVYGIDASVEGIEKGKSKFPDRFFIQDIENNALPKDIAKLKFDTIISTEVIEHIYDPKSFIGFCKKILNQNGGGVGELIISTPYHGYLKNILIAILNKWDDHHSVLWEGGHIKFWSRNTLSNLLNDYGFNIVVFEGTGRISYLWKSMIIKARI